MRVWAILQHDGRVDGEQLGLDVFGTKAGARRMCIVERGERVVEAELLVKIGRRITRKTAIKIAGKIQRRAERERSR